MATGVPDEGRVARLLFGQDGGDATAGAQRLPDLLEENTAPPEPCAHTASVLEVALGPKVLAERGERRAQGEQQQVVAVDPPLQLLGVNGAPVLRLKARNVPGELAALGHPHAPVLARAVAPSPPVRLQGARRQRREEQYDLRGKHVVQDADERGVRVLGGKGGAEGGRVEDEGARPARRARLPLRGAHVDTAWTLLLRLECGERVAHTLERPALLQSGLAEHGTEEGTPDPKPDGHMRVCRHARSPRFPCAARLPWSGKFT